MTVHTPLPWLMVRGTDGRDYISAVDGSIAVVSLRLDTNEQDANARLLLHAAELLAVLKAALAELDSDGIGAVVDVLEMAGRVAVAKVEVA